MYQHPECRSYTAMAGGAGDRYGKPGICRNKVFEFFLFGDDRFELNCYHVSNENVTLPINHLSSQTLEPTAGS